jgi:hypothetical protein
VSRVDTARLVLYLVNGNLLVRGIGQNDLQKWRVRKDAASFLTCDLSGEKHK